MCSRLPRLLAILTACSTMLAGIPLITAAGAADHADGPCVSTSPGDAADAADPRGENTGAEREETDPQEEDGDAKVLLFCGAAVASPLKAAPSGAVAAHRGRTVAGFRGPAVSIRGPPAR